MKMDTLMAHSRLWVLWGEPNQKQLGCSTRSWHPLVMSLTRLMSLKLTMMSSRQGLTGTPSATARSLQGTGGTVAEQLRCGV